MSGLPATWTGVPLPPMERIPVPAEVYFYGALHTAARFCALRNPPPVEAASWKHGIVENDSIWHPRQLVHYGGPEDLHLVAARPHVTMLERFGFQRAVAVGMPFLYAPAGDEMKIPSSLLVMVSHSSKHSRVPFDETAYLEAIMPSLTEFRTAVFCVHHSCVERGIWIDSLNRRGIPWVTGAAIDDRHALVRLRRLFGVFESVTAHSLVSGLAYAAACGCRVSLHSPFVEPCEDDLRKEPFYIRHPELLSPAVQRAREAAVRERLPWLFCGLRGTTALDWGRELVGEACKQSPVEMKKILGWTFSVRLRRALGRVFRS